MKNQAFTLSVRIGAVLATSVVVFFTAIIFAAGFGAPATVMAPEFHYQLLEDVLCPEGTTIDFYSVQRSYHEPGESEPHVECVYEDGTRIDKTLQGFFAPLGMYFIICFVPLFIPAALIAFFIPYNKFFNLFRRKKRWTQLGSPHLSDQPADVHQTVSQVMSMLEDTDGDGIPDALREGVQGNVQVIDLRGARGAQQDDPTEKLRQLKEMYDARLITLEEYEAKKAEILRRM